MSRLGCICGHIITDQTNNISYKGRFIRDQDFEEYSDKYTNDIASFIEAVKNNHRDEWIKNYFSETYPTNISNSSIVFDIVLSQTLVFESDLYQCENCGRIKIQVQDKNLYASFLPEDDRSRDILKKFIRTNNIS